MKTMSSPRLPKVVFLLLAGMLLPACSFLSLAASPKNTQVAGSSAAGITSASPAPQAEQSDSSTAFPTPEPDPLDRLLGMRSVKIDLTALHPDGKSTSILVEIDSSGNMHVQESFPAMDVKDLPKDTDPKLFASMGELFVLQGKAYHPDPFNSDWKTTPVDDDFNQTLGNELHGANGPAFWLDILPEGSIHAAGNDSVGGFAADKYTVSGQVGGQTISGTIWFEPKVDALIQAELSVPAALLGDTSQTGVLEITLNTQQASIPAVKLPDIVMATSQPQSTP
jgi:hypothetical protein